MFSEKPTIVGERVVLRPIVAADADAMWADLDDPEGARLTGTHATFTRAAIERWAATRADQPDRLDLAVTERATGAWLGEVVINDWDADNRCCGFRIALGPHGRDRGFGTEATRLIVDHIFATYEPVHRIELEVFAFNPRARAVYERVGFVYEGTRRDALRWDGEWVDAIDMAILRPDWQTARP
ncbi:MAG TPA: GNAT family protein [Ilumatobacter sp.]|nr:GNAT family protein [Ilumatobacter sp.]